MNFLTRLAPAAIAAVLVTGLAPAGTAAPAPDSATTPSQAADTRRSDRVRSGSALSDPILCPVDDISVPESSSAGVVTEWLAYGESLTVYPYSDQIWAGVLFTGWNGPAGWAGTAAPSYYPAPGAREYSLVGRFGSGAYQYLGTASRTFRNTVPGYVQRVRFRVNDNTPGNGAGAFRVYVAYSCR